MTAVELLEHSEDGCTLRVWREARRSALAALALLVILGGCFAAFLSTMPALKVRGRKGVCPWCAAMLP